MPKKEPMYKPPAAQQPMAVIPKASSAMLTAAAMKPVTLGQLLAEMNLDYADPDHVIHDVEVCAGEALSFKWTPAIHSAAVQAEAAMKLEFPKGGKHMQLVALARRFWIGAAVQYHPSTNGITDKLQITRDIEEWHWGRWFGPGLAAVKEPPHCAVVKAMYRPYDTKFVGVSDLIVANFVHHAFCMAVDAAHMVSMQATLGSYGEMTTGKAVYFHQLVLEGEGAPLSDILGVIGHKLLSQGIKAGHIDLLVHEARVLWTDSL